MGMTREEIQHDMLQMGEGILAVDDTCRGARGCWSGDVWLYSSVEENGLKLVVF